MSDETENGGAQWRRGYAAGYKKGCADALLRRTQSHGARLERALMGESDIRLKVLEEKSESQEDST